MRRHCFLWVTCCAVACLFFTTCGQDEYYVLAEPVNVDNQSIYSGTDYTNWYVDFFTNEMPNADYFPSKNAGFIFLGTGVYYKIYNSNSALESHRSRIEGLNTSSNYSAAATLLIETLGYQPLDTYPSLDWIPFVTCAEHNQHVQFRLKSYKSAASSEDFSALYRTNACIAFDNAYYGYVGSTLSRFLYDADKNQWTDTSGTVVPYESIRFLIPYRSVGQYSFDFFDSDENDSSHIHDRHPQEDDKDFYYSSGGSDTTYYVQLYAVAVGRDANYTTSYSLVLDLGTIPIKSDE